MGTKNIFEPTEENIKGWNDWVSSRPENVKQVAEKFFPWKLYKIKETGQKCTLYSFGETASGKVTLTVNVTGDFNRVMFDQQVFGLKPEDVEPCNPPEEGEILGTILTEKEDIEAYIDEIRPKILEKRKLN